VIVGRIIEVCQNFWRVDVNGTRDGILQLNSINFGGTQLRRLKTSDVHFMRDHFVEGDVISVGPIHMLFSFYSRPR
jgi:exosome complex RNA-binding protein Rrp4